MRESVSWVERARRCNLLSKVRNVSVNSTPEKRLRNEKCKFPSRFKRSFRSPSESFSYLPRAPSSPSETKVVPRVSGRKIARNAVSVSNRTSVRIAGVAYMFMSRVKERGKGWIEKYAPIGGPMVKHIENAMPTNISAAERRAGGVISERMALLVVKHSS